MASPGRNESNRVRKRIIHGDSELPVPNCSLSDFLLSRLRLNHDTTLMYDTDTHKSITCGEVLQHSIKLATVLRKREIKPNMRISIISENRVDFIIPVCASFFVGAIVAPLSPGYTEVELKPLLEIEKPSVIFVTRRTEQLLVKLAPHLHWVMDVIELDDEPVNKYIPTLKELLALPVETPDSELFQPVKIGDPRKHPAVILCSSGTTGLPKGVTLSDYNMVAFLTNVHVPSVLDVQPGSRMLMFLPFYHGYAFGTLLLMLAARSTAYISRVFDRQQFLNNVQQYKITHLALVPPICVFLAKDPSVMNYDFSSVKLAICGAAPFPKELLPQLKKVLRNSIILNAYGMTELTIVSHTTTRDSDNLESVGRPNPGYAAKIVDPETGELLEERKQGEICVKGGRVMMGYWDNPQATAASVDKAGWMHTGDLGYYDENGAFYVVGRLKEIIKYKGYQVSPVELEDLLLKHPDVKDAAVAGKPDEVSGELPAAFIVRQPNSNITEQDIIRFVHDKVSNAKRLRGGVKFVDAIPKNPTGKILRRELVKMVAKL